MAFVGIRHRRDTAADWTANNPILLDGQIGIETDSFTLSGGFRYYKWKLGDGATAWNSLPYMRLADPAGGGGSGVWGAITGTLSDQTDLQTALNAKQPLDTELTAFAGLTSAADKLPYFTGSGTMSTADFTALARNLVALAGPSAVRFYKVNADNTVSLRTAAEMLSDIGAQASGSYLITTNNLSDVSNAGTARTNLGATTVGGNIFTATNPGAVTFIRVNADNTVTFRTAAQTLSDIGGAADSAVVHNTGNETIAGVKTFSSDPIIPDEAYDATTWNGSLEPPTKNAIRDKIETMGGGGLDVGTTTIANGTAGRILFHGASDLLQESENFTIDESGTDKILKLGATAQGRINLFVSGSLKAYGTSDQLGQWVAGGDDVSNAAFKYIGGPGGMCFPTDLKLAFGMGGATMLYMQVSSIFQNGLAGITAPTAKLHIPGSTTAAGTAPLKLNSGTLMTTPENGAIETDGTDLWWTDDTGTRRKLNP